MDVSAQKSDALSSMSVKMKDHVGLLQDSFEEVLNLMFTTITAINRDAAPGNANNDPNQLKFDQLPGLADQIVKKVKAIDALIDEADQETCIGKDVKEIKESLAEKSAEYEHKVQELEPNCEAARKWIVRIKEMLDVIMKNTPLMQQCGHS